MSSPSSTTAPRPSHLERTAHEPRHKDQHPVTIESISRPNPTIRIIELSSAVPILFLPGQWLDVYCPDIPKAGGFSITSPPQRASSSSDADFRLELAVQQSPLNPAAAYLWKRPGEILNTQLRVRVGGSFTFPPAKGKKAPDVTRVVFVAGGVGINPIVSMVDSIVNTIPLESEESRRMEVDVLYGSRVHEGSGIEGVLFAPRLASLTRELSGTEALTIQLRLFLTGVREAEDDGGLHLEGAQVTRRRIKHEDVLDAIRKGHDKEGKLIYICGPPDMTDEFVGVLTENGVIAPERIMTEKWW